jgi:hypothetical protein
MIFVIYFIALLLAVPLFLTYRRKQDVLFWILVIAPPLLLTPLIVLPVNSPVALMLLLPMLLCLPVSLFILIVRTIQLGVKLTRKNPTGTLPLKFIRPGLVVLVFIVAAIVQRVSITSADRHAFDLAAQLQKQCETSGHCPAALDGWKTRPNFIAHATFNASHVRKLGIDYPLQYDATPDGKSFTITIVHGFNMGITIEGGIGKPLKAFRYSEGPRVEIPLITNTPATSEPARS